MELSSAPGIIITGAGAAASLIPSRFRAWASTAIMIARSSVLISDPSPIYALASPAHLRASPRHQRPAAHRSRALREPEQIDARGEVAVAAQTDHVVAGAERADRAREHAAAGDVEQLEGRGRAGRERECHRDVGAGGIRHP